MYVKWAWYLAKAIREQYLAEHPDAPIPSIANPDEIEHLDEDELQILFVQQVRFVIYDQFCKQKCFKENMNRDFSRYII